MPIIKYATMATIIIFNAPLLASAAEQFAEQFGLSHTFVKTTLVGLSTSLPELITTLTTVRLGSYAMAYGNIIGSNTFNMVIVGAADIAGPGSLLGQIDTSQVLTLLAGILVTAIVMMGQLYHVEKRIRMIEPDAAMVIVLVLGSLGGLYLLGA